MQLIYVAKKYMVKSLERRCIDYLRSELNAENALVLLNQSTLIDDEDLINECWKIIDKESEEIIKTDHFKDIDRNTLDDILSRDSLQSKEVSIFNAVLEWAKQACTRKSLPITAENQRKVLDDTFYKIRFPSMTEEEYADTAAQSGVLSFEESHNLFLYFKGKKQDLPFISTPRQASCQASFQPSFNRCEIYDNYNYVYDAPDDWGGVYFTTNRDIDVIGVSLCKIWDSICGSFNVAIQVSDPEDRHRLFIDGIATVKKDQSGKASLLRFGSPIRIFAGRRYKARAKLEDTMARRSGTQPLPRVECGGVTFKFSNHYKDNVISGILFKL